MTCIVGLTDGQYTYLGGDSLAGNNPVMRRQDPKVFVNGPFIIGGTTSFRMLDLLRHSLRLSGPGEDIDNMHGWMCTTFVDAVRDCLSRGGWRKKEHEVEEAGNFLVGYQECLFAVYADFQVARPLDGRAAIGCGDQIALGSLYSTEGYEGDPTDRLCRALKAAEHYTDGVRRPFHFVSTATRGYTCPEEA